MQFGDRPLSRCEGATLAHSVGVDGGKLAKGTVLTAKHIAMAKAAGHRALTVAIPAANDIPESEAAARLGTALAGHGISASDPVNGRTDLLARFTGLFIADERAVTRINGANEAIGLATLPSHRRVENGETVATLKIIPFAMRRSVVERAEMAAMPAPLTVRPFRPLSVLLVQTSHGSGDAKMRAKTERITEDRITALGGTLAVTNVAPHEAEPLAAALGDDRADIILIAGASATTDRRDVVPSAIRSAGGRIVRLGMPVDPGNLLLLAERGDQVIIGMPGCARSPKRNGFDMVLERLFAGLSVTSADIAGMGIGGLIKGADRPSR
ncbi:MAG: molybdopterin-binding protein [Pacificimonas sp.]|jgi:molybdenum cofactor cytidylyltransferase|nr:molybdopterin-binding protein [Pacificimonas sp.]